MPTPAQRLIFAVRTRRHDWLRKLIGKYGVTPSTESGRTALHAAAEDGDLLSAGILIDAGADVNGRLHTGQTPLHLAAAYGRGLDLLDPDLHALNPSRHRRRSTPPAVAKVLAEIIKTKDASIPSELEAGDDLPAEFDAAVFTAAWDCLANPQQLLDEIAARGIDLDALDPEMADDLRGKPRYLKCAELLLQHQADIAAVDRHHVSILRHAVEHGPPEMVTLLCKHGALIRPLSQAETAALFETCLERSNLATANRLVAEGLTFDPETTGLLHAAASSNLPDVVAWLLDHGADIEQLDDAGNTPLLVALSHSETTAILLDRGANAQAHNHQGDGALHAVAADPTRLELVLRLGLPVDEPNGEGRTALHLAASAAAHSSIHALLQAGASVNLCDHDGNMPLHRLFFSDEFRPDVEFPSFLALVSAGADLWKMNQAGKTAFGLATDYRYPDEYLELLNPALPQTDGFLWLGAEAYLGFLPTAMIGFELDGDFWPSSMHYFHAQKTTDPRLRERVRRTPSVAAAKALLQDAGIKPGPHWPATFDAVMRAALLAKFQQNLGLKQQLLATLNARLISDANCDSYWLERRGTSFNAIGKMIMSIRGQLQQEENTSS